MAKTGMWFIIMLAAMLGYLLGSINSAIIVSRFISHDDIRTHGSGNAGTTNMFRTYGKKAALLTAFGDILKAILAVLLGRLLFSLAALTGALPVDPGYLTGLFVLLGHIFPAFFKFKGGKGVMPAVAVILVVNPPAFLVMLAIALPVFLITRTMSLVSLISALALPVVTLALALLRQTNPRYPTLITLLYGILVIVSHRQNIRRLLHGQERPIWPRKS